MTYPTPEVEAVRFLQDLLRMDTTNTGEPETTKGEREVVEYCVARLAEVGIESRVFEPEPNRMSLVSDIVGDDPEAPWLLWHAHSDVVPIADADKWSSAPFGGEIRDGYIWGRGALDMKNVIAWQLAVTRWLKRSGTTLPYNMKIAVLADEEAGGRGATYLVENHPEVFAGCVAALGEVGGFSITLPNGRRIYPVMTGEKGMGWAYLKARGPAGHSAMTTGKSAVQKLAAAAVRVGSHTFPIQLTSTTRVLLTTIAEELGLPFDGEDERQIEAILDGMGPAGGFLHNSLRNTAKLTIFHAGIKGNMVPGEATGLIDCRTVPGQDPEEFMRQIEAIVGDDVEIEWPWFDPAWENDPTPELSTAIQASLSSDPSARAVPYLMPASTDGHAFYRLGIDCFGFTPMMLPPELNYMGLFHGVDERIPVSAVEFGVNAHIKFLRGYRPSPRPGRVNLDFEMPRLADQKVLERLLRMRDSRHAVVLDPIYRSEAQIALGIVILAADKKITPNETKVDLVVAVAGEYSYETHNSYLGLAVDGTSETAGRVATEQIVEAFETLDGRKDLDLPIVCNFDLAITSEEYPGMLPQAEKFGIIMSWLLKSPDFAGKDFHLHPPAGLAAWTREIAAEAGIAATVHPDPDDGFVRERNLWLNLPFRFVQAVDRHTDYQLQRQIWDQLTPAQRGFVRENLDDKLFARSIAEFAGSDWRARDQANRSYLRHAGSQGLKSSSAPPGCMVVGAPHKGLFAVASREVVASDREVNLHIVQAPPPDPRRDSTGPARNKWRRRDERPIRERRDAALDAAAHEAVDAPGGVPRVSVGLFGVSSEYLSLDLAQVLKDPRLGDLPITITFGDTPTSTRATVTEALDLALRAQPKLREKTITMPPAPPKPTKTRKSKKPGHH